MAFFYTSSGDGYREKERERDKERERERGVYEDTKEVSKREGDRVIKIYWERYDMGVSYNILVICVST